MDATKSQDDDVLRIGSHGFSSRLIVGTGKYASFELMSKRWTFRGWNASRSQCAASG